MTTALEEALRRMLQLNQAQPERVVWARSSNYQKQLYVSPSFSQWWPIDREQLYQHPESWDDFLINDDTAWWQPELKRRKLAQTNPHQSTLYYRFQGANGEIYHAWDQAFQVGQDAQAIVGVSTILSPERWHEQAHGHALWQCEDPDVDRLIEHLTPAPKPLLSAKPTAPLQLPSGLTLSKREQQVLFHTLSGRTAIDTASYLFISKRTVETHLDHLKLKFSARSKLELVNQLHQLLELDTQCV